MNKYLLIIDDNFDISIMKYKAASNGCNINSIASLKCVRAYNWNPDISFEQLINIAYTYFCKLKDGTAHEK